MKIKLPKFFTVKRKKLRAGIVRKPLRIAATANYDEMAEPNMKLSRALLIVLVLHVVAVSGIIAFNAIKTHQNVLPVTSSSSNGNSASASSTQPDVPSAHASPNAKEMVRHDEAKASHPASRQTTAKEERKPEHAKPASTAGSESGKVYVVAKGDNPVTIAKKLKVPYDELLALNHIDDPHKLQIGQKLVIPNKIPKAKKVDD
jgi:LysM repeat protein